MTREEVFSLVKQEIINTLPFVDKENIKQEKKLADFGANSIDRAEIAINCMRQLNISISPSQLASVKNISGLVDALFANLHQYD